MLSEKWKDAGECRGGSSSKVLLTAQGESTYKEDSLTSDSFHFMTQTPDHKFTSLTTETLPGPESLPNKSPIHHFFTLWLKCDVVSAITG